VKDRHKHRETHVFCGISQKDQLFPNRQDYRIIPLVSTPAAETLEREQDKLFVTDAELIRRIGVPDKAAREAIRMLEEKSGFPKKQKLWGDRRYWPAVKVYMDKQYGGGQT
jgi:hypothetical protein